MGIPYNNTIPATNNKPSNDQAPMQQNFASIQTLIDVDHKDFQVAEYGTHKQVTMLTNNVPPLILGAFQPTIFTNPGPSGTNQMFFYSGTPAQSSTQYVAGTNGSTVLMGGIIMKWFKAATTALNTTFNFSGGGGLGIADFPTAVYIAQVSVMSNAVAPVVVVSALSQSSITISLNSGAAIGVTVYVMILGA